MQIEIMIYTLDLILAKRPRSNDDVYGRNIMEDDARCIMRVQLTGDTIVAAATTIADGMELHVLCSAS